MQSTYRKKDTTKTIRHVGNMFKLPGLELARWKNGTPFLWINLDCAGRSGLIQLGPKLGWLTLDMTLGIPCSKMLQAQSSLHLGLQTDSIYPDPPGVLVSKHPRCPGATGRKRKARPKAAETDRGWAMARQWIGGSPLS